MTVSPADPVGALQQLQADLALVALGRARVNGPWCAVRGEEAMQAKAPEETRVRSAAPVVGGVGQLGSTGRLDRAGALDGGRVDEQEVVVVAGL
jgi:hypothetical protein